MASKGIPPTVGNFVLVLKSKLTQYDQKAKHGSPYRLGHLLNAAAKVEEEVLRHASPTDTMSEDTAVRFITAMAGAFTVNPRENKFDLAPCRNVVKQLEAFLASGKNPSLVSS
jgi:hypothetical protein